MPFCEKCGIKMNNGAVFCPECGTPVNNTKSSKKSVEEVTDDFKTQVRGKTPSYGILNLENLPEGHIIDERYEIKQKIGQGGFGAVYLVYDKNMNIDKALKIIPEAVSSDKEAMFDLQNEAQTMIALNNPNIVRVYDFHKTGDIKFIDMEFVDGKTLTELKLEYKNKQVPEEQVKELAVQIASGMSYAHQNGILHKDIKPQNVILTKDNNVKIMDFGIAETVRTSMSRIQNSSSSGTLVYMSPEQIKGKDVGKESDIYSFGAMLYELLSGHPPFYKGDINYQILNEKTESLENVSGKMNELVLKCLEKEYKNRFMDFGEIIKLLGGIKVNYSPSSASKSQKPLSSSKLKMLSTVYIQTEPAEAKIIIGKKEYKTPFEQKLTTGSHQIKISKIGYKIIEDEITISENSNNDFYLELEKLHPIKDSNKQKKRELILRFINISAKKFADKENINISPNITLLKRNSIIDSYASKYSAEDILLTLDTTIFGGGKYGFCLTVDGICWRNNDERPQFKDYESIGNVSYKKGKGLFGISNIYIDGSKIKVIGVMDEIRFMEEFVELLNKLKNEVSENEKKNH